MYNNAHLVEAYVRSHNRQRTLARKQRTARTSASKVKRNLTKQSQKKSNTNCPKDKTEYLWAKERGFARIWDCGKKRWKIII